MAGMSARHTGDMLPKAILLYEYAGKSRLLTKQTSEEATDGHLRGAATQSKWEYRGEESKTHNGAASSTDAGLHSMIHHSGFIAASPPSQPARACSMASTL